jgi:hypothetical protein
MDEEDETFTLTLADAANCSLAKGEASGEIRDDDRSVSVEDITVDEGQGEAEFIVKLSSAPRQGEQVSVSYTTGDGSARSGLDYVAQAGSLTFTEGQLQQAVAVKIEDDPVDEENELFALILSDAIGAKFGRATATGTVLDNDESVGPGSTVPECGTPTYDSSTEAGIFLYRDCTNPQQWHARMTAGGRSLALAYRGTITSNQPFPSVGGFSQEPSDSFTLDNSRGLISFVQYVSRKGVDGIDFSVEGDAEACFSLSSPEAATVWLGADRVVVKTPVNLTTLDPCTP